MFYRVKEHSFAYFSFVLLFLSLLFAPRSLAAVSGTRANEKENQLRRELTKAVVQDGHPHGNSSTDENGHTDHGHSDDSHKNQESLLETLFPGMTGAPNLHPMVVHFPLALLLVATVLVLLSFFWKPEESLRVAKWCFWIGLGFLPVAAATGFYAIGGWGSGHVTPHRNLMLITTGIGVILGVVLFLLRKKPDSVQRWVLTIGLFLLSITMILGADRGAWLVFVEGSGVKSEGHIHQQEGDH